MKKWTAKIVVSIQCASFLIGNITSTSASVKDNFNKSTFLDEAGPKSISEHETKLDRDLFLRLSGIRTLKNLNDLIQSITFPKEDQSFFNAKIAQLKKDHAFNLDLHHKGLFRYDFNIDGITGSLVPGPGGAHILFNHFDIRIEQGMSFEDLYKKVEAAFPKPRETTGILRILDKTLVPLANASVAYIVGGALVLAGVAASYKYVGKYWIACADVKNLKAKCGSENFRATESISEWIGPDFKASYDTCDDLELKNSLWRSCSFKTGFGKQIHDLVYPVNSNPESIERQRLNGSESGN